MLRTPSTDEEAKRILKLAKPEWLGLFGEAIWCRVLAAAGWHYVSLTKICEGGAPLARGKDTKLILPDFEAYQGGKNVFVEAKAKTTSIVYRKKKQERHGINERNYHHYTQIQRVSGKPCCIGLVELCRESTEDGSTSWSGSLLFEKLADLLPPSSEFEESPRKVYWPRKQFRELQSGYTPRELFMLANGDLQEEFQVELNDILFPQKQKPLFA